MLWCHGCCYPLQGRGSRFESLPLGAQDDYEAASGRQGIRAVHGTANGRKTARSCNKNVAIRPSEDTWSFHVKHDLLRRI